MEQLNIQTFALVWSDVILPIAGVFAGQAFIDRRNNPFKIKSVFFNWRCRNESANLGNMPIENNITQEIELSMIGIPGDVGQLASPFTGVGPVPAANGTNLIFYQPGQYFFDDFYVRRTLDVIYTQTNRDIANSVHFWASIIMQIETI